MDVSRETSRPPPPPLDPAVRARLHVYLDLLVRWNTRINLVANGEVPHLWRRHVEDSLQLLEFMPSSGEGPAIDLGSGGGFPGLVLAIASARPFHLIESDRRKAAFLLEAVRETRAPAMVHNSRIELVQLPPAALITARALASLDTLLGLAAPLLAPNGICLFPKGRYVEDELTIAARQWHMNVAQAPSRTDPAGTILIISEVRRVGPPSGS